MTTLSSKTETEAKQPFRMAWRLERGRQKEQRLYKNRGDRSGKGGGGLLQTSRKIKDKETREEFWTVGKGGSGGGKNAKEKLKCVSCENMSRRSSEWCKRVGWNLLKRRSQGNVQLSGTFVLLKNILFSPSLHSLFQHKEVFKNINQKRIKKTEAFKRL